MLPEPIIIVSAWSRLRLKFNLVICKIIMIGFVKKLRLSVTSYDYPY